MEWYWYVLIAVGIIGLGILKGKVWNNLRKKRQEKENQNHHEED
jgi:hypothetical protein